MSAETLTQRVVRLEEQIRAIMENTRVNRSEPIAKDWRRTVGMFRNDAIMASIIEAGRCIRDDDRRQAQS